MINSLAELYCITKLEKYYYFRLGVKISIFKETSQAKLKLKVLFTLISVKFYFTTAKKTPE